MITTLITIMITNLITRIQVEASGGARIPRDSKLLDLA
jgi:hypothetical protein